MINGSKAIVRSACNSDSYRGETNYGRVYLLSVLDYTPFYCNLYL